VKKTPGWLLGADHATRKIFPDEAIAETVREAWDTLTPHLLAWGDHLRRDGVLYVIS
jgi:hypothetical protein